MGSAAAVFCKRPLRRFALQTVAIATDGDYVAVVSSRSRMVFGDGAVAKYAAPTHQACI